MCVYELLSCVWLFVNPWTVCSPPGSSVHGILQARILEWVAIHVSRVFSNPGIKPRSLTLQADSLPSLPFWATRLASIKCSNDYYQCNSTLRKKKVLFGQVTFLFEINDSFHVSGMGDWEDGFSNSWFIQYVGNENGHLYAHLDTDIGFL